MVCISDIIAFILTACWSRICLKVRSFRALSTYFPSTNKACFGWNSTSMVSHQDIRRLPTSLRTPHLQNRFKTRFPNRCLRPLIQACWCFPIWPQTSSRRYIKLDPTTFNSSFFNPFVIRSEATLPQPSSTVELHSRASRASKWFDIKCFNFPRSQFLRSFDW